MFSFKNTCAFLLSNLFVCQLHVENFVEFINNTHNTLSSSLAPVKSRMEAFWYWLTQVNLENGR